MNASIANYPELASSSDDDERPYQKTSTIDTRTERHFNFPFTSTTTSGNYQMHAQTTLNTNLDLTSQSSDDDTTIDGMNLATENHAQMDFLDYLDETADSPAHDTIADDCFAIDYKIFEDYDPTSMDALFDDNLSRFTHSIGEVASSHSDRILNSISMRATNLNFF